MSIPLRHIIISRTDSIGDVILTLPMCGRIKSIWPNCRITFLGRGYTEAVIRACMHVDDYINWDEIKTHAPAEQMDRLAQCEADAIIHVYPRKEILWIAKKAGIPLRISTGHRLHALTKCNKLVFFSRSKSELHEAQLNFKLLLPLGISDQLTMTELPLLYGFKPSITPLPKLALEALDEVGTKRKIILHPLSKGSAPEWSMENYTELINRLPDNEYHFFLTGTAEEGERIRAAVDVSRVNVTDMTGRLSLGELIAFIGRCDMLIAASTGPLHIAAAAGIRAIGLFSPKRPMHPGRWAPVGARANVICADAHPKKNAFLPISSEQVLKAITSAWL